MSKIIEQEGWANTHGIESVAKKLLDIFQTKRDVFVKAIGHRENRKVFTDAIDKATMLLESGILPEELKDSFNVNSIRDITSDTGGSELVMNINTYIEKTNKALTKKIGVDLQQVISAERRFSSSYNDRFKREDKKLLKYFKTEQETLNYMSELVSRGKSYVVKMRAETAKEAEKLRAAAAKRKGRIFRYRKFMQKQRDENAKKRLELEKKNKERIIRAKKALRKAEEERAVLEQYEKDKARAKAEKLKKQIEKDARDKKILDDLRTKQEELKRRLTIEMKKDTEARKIIERKNEIIKREQILKNKAEKKRQEAEAISEKLKSIDEKNKHEVEQLRNEIVKMEEEEVALEKAVQEKEEVMDKMEKSTTNPEAQKPGIVMSFFNFIKKMLKSAYRTVVPESVRKTINGFFKKVSDFIKKMWNMFTTFIKSLTQTFFSIMEQDTNVFGAEEYISKIRSLIRNMVYSFITFISGTLIMIVMTSREFKTDISARNRENFIQEIEATNKAISFIMEDTTLMEQEFTYDAFSVTAIKVMVWPFKRVINGFERGLNYAFVEKNPLMIIISFITIMGLTLFFGNFYSLLRLVNAPTHIVGKQEAAV